MEITNIITIKVTDLIKDFATDKGFNNYNNFNTYDEVLREDNKGNFESIKDFILDNYQDVFYSYEGISDDEELQELKDYVCGTTDYIQDSLNEKADGLIDIYYSDIYKSVPEFSEWINQAKEEFGTNESIDKEIQQGQYLFYSEVLGVINDLFGEYLDNFEDFEELKKEFEE